MKISLLAMDKLEIPFKQAFAHASAIRESTEKNPACPCAAQLVCPRGGLHRWPRTGSDENYAPPHVAEFDSEYPAKSGVGWLSTETLAFLKAEIFPSAWETIDKCNAEVALPEPWLQIRDHRQTILIRKE